MADEQQLAVLRQGRDAWNAWREQNPNVRVDLTKAILAKADLSGANLATANLNGAKLNEAHLNGANLAEAYLMGTDLSRAYLFEANLLGAYLIAANLSRARLIRAHLFIANLFGARAFRADLSRADLTAVNLSRADLTEANLTGCRVFGISAWDLKLDGAEQKNLIITQLHEPEITVDNLEVAQFIYLLLKNERVRHVIDTVTSKVVLILGRFTPERKMVLDALKEELRQRNYTPVLFDFDKPASKDLTGTVQTLANMARFVIADLTDPSSVPHELAMVVPTTPVPVQPVLLDGQREYAMFVDLKRRHHWVLEPYSYASQERLIADLSEHVIAPAEAKTRELRGLPPPT